jgi:carboxyl-terminal processing protease
VPDIWLDETAEGNVFAALRTREADLQKHLSEKPGATEARDEAREKVRAEERRKIEEQLAKQRESIKPLPEFGSEKDFPLQQALNQLRGKPVVVSKTATERKASADTAGK